MDQLFIDGQCQRMARYPNFDATKPTAAYQGFAADAFSKQRAARWADPTGAYIHAMHQFRWGGFQYRITGKGADGEVTYEGGWQNIRIQDCELDQPGGNGIFVSGYNRQNLVKGCYIHDTGASGVAFVGAADAVRNPLTNYGQRHNHAKIDRTPGPKSPDYPADCRVEDSLIHGIGRVERQPAGVQISMAQGITVRDCSERNDLVQSINGKKTRSLAEFQAVLRAAGSAPLKVKLVRAQSAMTLEIPK